MRQTTLFLCSEQAQECKSMWRSARMEESCLTPSPPDPEEPGSLRQAWDLCWVSGIGQKDLGLTIK